MEAIIQFLLQVISMGFSKIRQLTVKYKDLEISILSKPPDKKEAKPTSKEAYQLIVLIAIILLLVFRNLIREPEMQQLLLFIS